MTTTTTVAIRRNTAVTASSLVDVPVLSLLREEVPDGTLIFGFDPAVPVHEAWIFAADGDGTREVDQHLEHPFGLHTWVAKRVKIPDIDTGDETVGVRITLIDDEGETLTFVSVGIAASLDLIRTLRGDGPYQPVIPVIFKRVKTRRGFNTIKMRPVTTPVVKKK